MTEAAGATFGEARIVNRDFVLLVVGHFLQALGYSSMLLLPVYLDWLGASRAEIGGIMATAALAGLVTRPLVGWALDSWGRRKSLWVGTCLLVSGMLLVAAVQDLGFLVYGMRILVGVGTGTLFTGYFALASDIIPSSRRTEGLALFGVSGLLPLVIAPFALEIGVEAAELRFFFPVVGGIVMSSMLFTTWVRGEPAREEKKSFRWRDAIRNLGRAELRSVWLATIIFAALVAVFMSFATVVAEARGLERPAVLWLSYSFGAVVVRLFGAKLPAMLGDRVSVLFSLGSYIMALLVIGGASTELAFLVGGLCGGVGHGYCFPVLTSQTVSRVDSTNRGSALAMFTGLWDLSRVLCAPLFGWVADVSSDRLMMWTAGGAAAVGLWLWSRLEGARSGDSLPA